MPALMFSRAAAAAIALCALALPGHAGAQASPLLVAAASDLRFALNELLEQFSRETGIAARAAYGASGNLARQIEQGAPFELFLSADEAFVLDLARKGLTRGEGELYAVGRIALFAPAGSALTPDPELGDLRRRIAEGTLGRFAIANPEHAPYGRAAEQALRSLELWEAVQPSLVLGENVAQAAQFAASGNAGGGIVAYSLVLAPQLAGRGAHALIPETLHAPLRQRMVLTRHASTETEALYAYLRSPSSRAVFARYGFTLPED